MGDTIRHNDAGELATYYSELAADYEERISKAAHYGARVCEFLDLHAEPGTSVLDVGCGPAHLTAHLGANVRLVGIDLSPGMIGLARRARPDARFELHDFHEPLPDDIDADVAIVVGCLEFARDLTMVLRNIAGAMRPGGRALVSVPERCPPDHDRALHSMYSPSHGVWITFGLHREAEAVLAATDAGFDVEHVARSPGWRRDEGKDVPYLWLTLVRRG